jgi:hypothetical protein
VPPATGTYTGMDLSSPDLADWAVDGFHGSLEIQMMVPTYQSANPAQGGNQGSNISQGIYGQPSAPTCAGTQYFFSTPDGTDPAHPTWGPYRDVDVFTYDICQRNAAGACTTQWPVYWNDKTNVWQTGTSGGPDRVRLVRLMNFRVYRDYDTSSSRIWGRLVSKVMPPDTPPGCSAGPNAYANIVRMGQ